MEVREVAARDLKPGMVIMGAFGIPAYQVAQVVEVGNAVRIQVRYRNDSDTAWALPSGIRTWVGPARDYKVRVVIA